MRELPVSTESDSQVPMEDSQPISLDSQPTNKGTTDGASYGSATVGLTLPALASKVRTGQYQLDIACTRLYIIMTPLLKEQIA